MVPLENFKNAERYAKYNTNHLKSYLLDMYILMTVNVYIFMYKDTHIYGFI